MIIIKSSFKNAAFVYLCLNSRASSFQKLLFWELNLQTVKSSDFLNNAWEGWLSVCQRAESHQNLEVWLFFSLKEPVGTCRSVPVSVWVSRSLFHVISAEFPSLSLDPVFFFSDGKLDLRSPTWQQILSETNSLTHFHPIHAQSFGRLIHFHPIHALTL